MGFVLFVLEKTHMLTTDLVFIYDNSGDKKAGAWYMTYVFVYPQYNPAYPCVLYHITMQTEN